MTQTARWRVDMPVPWTSGVLATAGGLVFHAGGDDFAAYDAASGRRLWSYDTGANVIAPASTYEIDGEQYVALMVGVGGAPMGGPQQPRRPGRLLVFKLGGAIVPPTFAKVTPMPPLDLATATPSRGDPEKGAGIYASYCMVCHRPGGFLPDLARTPALLDPDGFKAIVLDGALKDRGMVSFRRFFGEADAEDLRAYLLWLAAQPAPAASPKPGGATHG